MKVVCRMLAILCFSCSSVESMERQTYVRPDYEVTTGDSNQVQERRYVFPDDPSYSEWQLSRYNLEALNDDESIRFLWLRAFHPSIVFEVRTVDDETIEFTARVWKSDNWEVFNSKTLAADDSRLVTTLELDLFGFFEMPSFSRDDFRYADGASWIFEAKSKERYNWVWKQSPNEDTHFGRWGRAMIEESIDSPAVPIY